MNRKLITIEAVNLMLTDCVELVTFEISATLYIKLTQTEFRKAHRVRNGISI